MWIKNKEDITILPFYLNKVHGIVAKHQRYQSLYQNASLEIAWTKAVIDNNSISGNEDYHSLKDVRS